METLFETESIGQCRTRISFNIPAGKVDEAFDRAFEAVRPAAVVPGFRPGRAPRPMIERKYGKIIREEALNKLLPDYYLQAVRERSLHPIADPTFDNVKYEKGQPLTFTATVEIMPEFDLPSYMGIAIKKVEAKEPGQEDIGKVLDMHRQYHAKYEPVDNGPVEEGHFVQVNIHQEIDGEKNSRENQMLEIDKEKIFPEFVSNLVGITQGETVSFDMTFPDDYQSKEVAGKTVHYEVELLEIKRKVLPELDDDFAKDTGRADTIDGLKEDVRKTLKKDNEDKARSEEENQLIDTLLDQTDFEIPPSMLQVQMQNNIRRTLQYSMYSGVPREDLESRKEEIFKKAEDDSKRQIKLFLMLQRIAEKEGVTVTDEELDGRIAGMAAERRMEVQTLREQMEKEDEIDSLRNRLTHDKVLKLLYENAKRN